VRVAILDLDLDRGQAVADRYGGGKVADVRTGIDLDGCDVLVNSASYRVNLDAMRACLRAGAHYIDLGACTG
jgi:hypothetical protein